MKLSASSAALIALAFGSAPAISHADVFFLTNDAGGDGYFNPVPGGYDLFGSDNGAAENTTSLLATAGAAETVTYNYTYTSHDIDGAFFDPGGYVVNGVETQVSPPNSNQGDSNSGSVTFSLNPGDSYGFYVFTTDGVLGRGEILFTSTVPEPASWAMMLAGFGLVGVAARRRSRAVA